MLTTADELDSYMYQTVGHNAIDLYAQAMDLPLYRGMIKGSSVSQGKVYIESQGDEVEDLYKLLKKIKVPLIPVSFLTITYKQNFLLVPVWQMKFEALCLDSVLGHMYFNTHDFFVSSQLCFWNGKQGSTFAELRAQAEISAWLGGLQFQPGFINKTS